MISYIIQKTSKTSRGGEGWGTLEKGLITNKRGKIYFLSGNVTYVTIILKQFSANIYIMITNIKAFLIRNCLSKLGYMVIVRNHVTN